MNGSQQMITGNYFTINWQIAQNTISSSTYALAGYQMTVLHKYMSFQGYFPNIGPNSAIFLFTPIYSSFFRVKFYLILFIPCSDQIIVR